MSPTPSEPESVLSNWKAQSLYRYLRDRLLEQDTDEFYCKGKEIADDVGLSSKEIGVMMKRLQDTETDVVVEKWSWSRATTWRISLRETTEVDAA
jgi:hypothetical protein